MRDRADDIEHIAYAIGKVIAGRLVEQDAKLRTLDGLGRISAVHELAQRMAGELSEEAQAAYDAMLSDEAVQ